MRSLFHSNTSLTPEQKLEKDKATVLKDITSVGDELIAAIDAMKSKSDDALGLFLSFQHFFFLIPNFPWHFHFHFRCLFFQ